MAYVTVRPKPYWSCTDPLCETCAAFPTQSRWDIHVACDTYVFVEQAALAAREQAGRQLPFELEIEKKRHDNTLDGLFAMLVMYIVLTWLGMMVLVPRPWVAVFLGGLVGFLVALAAVSLQARRRVRAVWRRYEQVHDPPDKEKL